MKTQHFFMVNLCITALAIIGYSGNASGQSLEWVGVIGGGGLANDVSVVLDKRGSIYCAGSFDFDSDFDPGIGVMELENGGNADMFIAKYGVDGSYVFAKNVGGTQFTLAHAITVDDLGNIYVTGSFADTTDFNPSADSAIFVSNGAFDVFIAKYDSLGNYLFARTFGSVGNDRGYSIAVDSEGNIFTTGYFSFDMDFDPSSLATDIHSNNGEWDVFLTKYDPDGNYIFTKTFGGNESDVAWSMTLDESDNIYVTGAFANQVDFDPDGSEALLISNGEQDIFISKYDSDGNYQFAKNMGGDGNEYGKSIDLDPAGNMYITGSFRGTADFDPSQAQAILASGGQSDIYFAKYNSTGAYVYAKRMGSIVDDYGSVISVDAFGTVYLTGSFSSTVDFNPGTGTANLTSNGFLDNDIYIAKYDSAGNYISAKGIGGHDTDLGKSLAIDTLGNMFVAGGFQGVVDFDPDLSVVELVAPGPLGKFIAMYSTPTVGIRETLSSQIQLYPNPSSNQVRIELLSDLNVEAINIFDSRGSLLQTEMFNNARFMDLQLPVYRGLYFLQLIGSGTTVFTLKVIKE